MLQSISDRISQLEVQSSTSYRGSSAPCIYTILGRLDALVYGSPNASKVQGTLNEPDNILNLSRDDTISLKTYLLQKKENVTEGMYNQILRGVVDQIHKKIEEGLLPIIAKQYWWFNQIEQRQGPVSLKDGQNVFELDLHYAGRKRRGIRVLYDIEKQEIVNEGWKYQLWAAAKDYV